MGRHRHINLQNLRGFILHSRFGAVVLAVSGVLIACSAAAGSEYVKYSRLVDEKLRAGLFQTSTFLYAAPRVILSGQDASLEDLASYLRRCGYSNTVESRGEQQVGWYRRSADSIEVHPGPNANVQGTAEIQIRAGRVSRIVSIGTGSSLPQLDLEPEIITNLFDQSREKQLLVRFAEIPQVLRNAVLAAEDKRFFHHWGFDPEGILRAAWVDLREHRRAQGASTLTQQLARTLWLGPERGWRRKIPETLITLHLENTLTKQQIFEDYANTIYLGNLGSFSIHGFGKASRLYLGKNLGQLTLADAALLAGMIQAPYSRNPFRYPERARTRRNAILSAMLANRSISQRDYAEAAASPLKVAREEGDSSDAPYFIDLVDETLDASFPDRDFRSRPYRVYTTLDMDLQRDAVDAVRLGIQETDQQWKRRSKQYGTSAMPVAQAALIALDAQTGEIKALVGGRSYGASQFDHATARRQPGSSFKPFVYAAALSAALSSDGPALTAASTVDDEPTTFVFNGQNYQPDDHNQQYAGLVTLRYALAHSLNIPAVKIAEEVGYDKVVRVAKAAGLNVDIAPTPSIALGSYEVTPLEMAGAYTVFTNNGSRISPGLIRAVRDPQAKSIFEAHPARKAAIDPRVAYVVENMMEEVLRSGTGTGVRSRGFSLPAAGKTGTSHDGWFAGFTSKLICVVWVGFDDNRDIKLEGAHSALPIWTEFMKRAHQHPEYRNVRGFAPPSGIVSAEIDADTGELATPNCPNVRSEVFIEGTEPHVFCHVHGGRTAAAIALERH